MTDERLVYKSGDFVPESEASLSIFDSGVGFGHMVFEVTRTFKHAPFRLTGQQGHLERLEASLKCAQIDSGMTPDELEAATFETIDRNLHRFGPDDDFWINHYISNGTGDAGGRPSVLIYVRPLTASLAGRAHFYDEGVDAVIPAQQSVPARLIDPKIKNTSRLYYRLADRQAKQVSPDAWALLTDEDGFITEGTGSNFMIIKDGVLISPEPRNILLGITRGAIIDVAAKVGVPFREQNIDAYDVTNADEAFLQRYLVRHAARADDRRTRPRNRAARSRLSPPARWIQRDGWLGLRISGQALRRNARYRAVARRRLANRSASLSSEGAHRGLISSPAKRAAGSAPARLLPSETEDPSRTSAYAFPSPPKPAGTLRCRDGSPTRRCAARRPL